MTAYYNEIDPFAAAWLRELIKAGHIAPGDVDTRSIVDVRPDDLKGYVQCHFFAGIGVWSYALRRAGWADDRPVWTGSCPCQPFSAAGKGGGFDDERHLWPHFYWLISQRRPAVVFGEQVASKAVDPWIDLVHADLEAVDYAFASVPFPSAGVGAPHIRDRNWWAASALAVAEHQRKPATGQQPAGAVIATRASQAGRMADADDTRPQGRLVGRDGAGQRAAGPRGVAGGMPDTPASGRREERSDAGRLAIGNGAQGIAAGSGDGSSDCVGGLGDTGNATGQRDTGTISGTETREHGARFSIDGGLPIGSEHASAGMGLRQPGPTNGIWRDADWLFCRDGKWRPVEPGTFPLAHGAAARVGRLRGYGNAINAEAATAFIEAYLERSDIVAVREAVSE